MNRTSAVFKVGSRNVTAVPELYQWDYGQILDLEGLELPDTFEVHFSNHEFCGGAKAQLGSEGSVGIPDEYLEPGEPVYAFIYLHTDEGDGETEYKIKIPVRKRPRPQYQETTAHEESIISQAITALNEAVEETSQYAAEAQAAAEDAVAAMEAAEAVQDAVETARDEAVLAAEGAALSEAHAAEIAENIDDIVAESLQEAKDSGMFDGEKGDQGDKGDKGDQGDKGDTGEPGITYVLEPSISTITYNPSAEEGSHVTPASVSFSAFIIQGGAKTVFHPTRTSAGWFTANGAMHVKTNRGGSGVTVDIPDDIMEYSSVTANMYDEDSVVLAKVSVPVLSCGRDGAPGTDGAVYTPSVSAVGVMSWTNDQGLPNPQSVDLVTTVINNLPLASGGRF